VSGEQWPSLPLAEWRDTYATLHMWLQIVGKVRTRLSAPVNHSWSSALYVTARGLTTSPLHSGSRTLEMSFDFIDHNLFIQRTDGAVKVIGLFARSVAEFYHDLFGALHSLDINVTINPMPQEVPDPVRCDTDDVHASYDPEYANRFWRVLVQADRVFKIFRSRFLGKCSPVHFFWGSCDLAVTRFSGRRAPRHPGGVPNLSDEVACEAYSHEVSSAGFWPGGGAIDYPAFYSYAYPMPEGFRSAPVRPEAAFFSQELGEFLLPYEAVQTAASPDGALLDFLQSTYEAAADAGKWDRAALECAPGIPGEPRAIS
jgi:hypothetical protein